MNIYRSYKVQEYHWIAPKLVEGRPPYMLRLSGIHYKTVILTAAMNADAIAKVDDENKGTAGDFALWLVVLLVAVLVPEPELAELEEDKVVPFLQATSDEILTLSLSVKSAH